MARAARVAPRLMPLGAAQLCAAQLCAAQLCAMLLCAAVSMAPAEASAATRCHDFMLMCNIGNISQGVNAKVLLGNKARLRQVQRHIRACELMIDTERPRGCDWKASIKAGIAAAPSTHARADVPTPAPPGGSAADKPSPRRDVSGRYGTTPAPSRQPAVAAPDRGPYADAIARAATRYKLPPDLVRAVIQVESAFNPEAVSVKGAVGLMQLLPETGKAMGAVDLRDPEQNIAAGARFLRLLANRFKGDLVKVLSAYHAGSTRVLRREATPFAATDSYVRKVLGVYYALRDG